MRSDHTAGRTLFTLAPASQLLGLVSMAGGTALAPSPAPDAATQAATVRMAGSRGVVQIYSTTVRDCSRRYCCR